MTTLTTRRFATRAAFDAALEERIGRALDAGTPSALMLSGGKTPLAAYRTLAQRSWPHTAGLHVLFSDDRYVPSEAQASNYHQSQALLAALALPAAAIVRVRTELPLPQAAADYEQQLAALLSSGVRVDLGLLGLGADGHTASLFATADLARARGHLAIAVQRPDGMSGVSVTPDFLSQVAEPVFAVAGSDKQAAIRAFTAGAAGSVAWQAVQGCPQVQLWVYEGE
jgi:6-phosphogluconolactonase